MRLVAQGRADAIVENIDFFMKHTKNYPDVKWKVAAQPDRCRLVRHRRAAAATIRCATSLNIILYNLHSSNFVNETWEKWYGAPMLVKVVPNPYF